MDPKTINYIIDLWEQHGHAHSQKVNQQLVWCPSCGLLLDCLGQTGVEVSTTITACVEIWDVLHNPAPKTCILTECYLAGMAD